LLAAKRKILGLSDPCVSVSSPATGETRCRVRMGSLETLPFLYDQP